MGHFDTGWVVVVSNISTEQIQGRYRFIYWLMRGCAGNRVKIRTPNQSHNAIQHWLSPNRLIWRTKLVNFIIPLIDSKVICAISLFASFFVGFLADLSGAYTLTFYIAGTFHVVAGCILFLSYCVKGTKRSREDLTKMLPLENLAIIEKVTVL